jgi:hypothetical protein
MPPKNSRMCHPDDGSRTHYPDGVIA